MMLEAERHFTPSHWRMPLNDANCRLAMPVCLNAMQASLPLTTAKHVNIETPKFLGNYYGDLNINGSINLTVIGIECTVLRTGLRYRREAILMDIGRLIEPDTVENECQT